MTTSQEETLLSLLSSGVQITTRIRETGRGDVHDAPSFPQSTTGSLSGCQLVTLLEELESANIIEREERVSDWDTSEYLVSWHLMTNNSQK
jgi:hypothetical protein